MAIVFDKFSKKVFTESDLCVAFGVGYLVGASYALAILSLLMKL